MPSGNNSQKISWDWSFPSSRFWSDMAEENPEMAMSVKSGFFPVVFEKSEALPSYRQSSLLQILPLVQGVFSWGDLRCKNKSKWPKHNLTKKIKCIKTELSNDLLFSMHWSLYKSFPGHFYCYEFMSFLINTELCDAEIYNLYQERAKSFHKLKGGGASEPHRPFSIFAKAQENSDFKGKNWWGSENHTIEIVLDWQTICLVTVQR